MAAVHAWERESFMVRAGMVYTMLPCRWSPCPRAASRPASRNVGVGLRSADGQGGLIVVARAACVPGLAWPGSVIPRQLVLVVWVAYSRLPSLVISLLMLASC